MNILFKGIMAILPDGVKKSDIYIQGNKITGIDSCPEGFNADSIISGDRRILSPGLINTHAHSYMTVFRNLADDLSFDDWLFGRVMPMEDRLTAEEAYWGTLAGCMEMISNGCTCFLDMHMFPHRACHAVLDSGMRAVISRGLSGGADDVAGGERRLREAIEEIEVFKNEKMLSFLLGPHAPYSCDPGYLKEIASAAEKLGVGFNIHLSESVGEVQGTLDKYGCTPAEYFDKWGMLTDKTVAAHCVHLTESDIALLAKREVSVSLNPSSNLKLGNGIAPVPDMLRAGINLCLGTDSCASNNSLSILKEMELTALLHKGITHDPVAVTADQAFNMATVNGAKALGMGGVTGEIREGLLADLAVFRTDMPGLTPIGDVKSALVYSNSGLKAEMVFVDGKKIFDNGVFPGINSDEVAENCKKAVEHVTKGGK